MLHKVNHIITESEKTLEKEDYTTPVLFAGIMVTI